MGNGVLSGAGMDAAAEFSGFTAVAQPPGMGLLSGTTVRTLDGVLPVEYLSPGDRIVTRAGARRLAAVSVQKRRDAALVRIRASVLGPDSPERDLLVAPGQPVLIRDWRAVALYGSAVAAIPADRLVDGEFVLTVRQQSARLFILRFDRDEVIYAEGLELTCPALIVAETARLAYFAG